MLLFINIMSIDTNWCVITGGPSSGKTKTIEHLASLGYEIVSEAARILIDAEAKKGKTIEEIRRNEAEFQRKILQTKIETEEKLSPEQVIFFDRGIPDSVAYYQLCGLDADSVKKESKKRKYRRVFLLEQLQFEKDYARSENEKLAGILSRLIRKAYSDLGYDIIFVSRASVEKRAEFIVSKLNR